VPYGRNKIISGKHAPGVPGEMDYQIEHLRLDLVQLFVPAKFEAIDIQLKFAKGQNHAQSPVYPD
jgi:hypothetical protein